MFVYHVYESLTDSVWGCFHERIVCVCSGRNHFLSNQAIKWPSFCYEHFPSNRGGGGGYSPEFLVGVCRPGLQISDLNMPFSTPVFRPDLYNSYPFSDLIIMHQCRTEVDARSKSKLE